MKAYIEAFVLTYFYYRWLRQNQELSVFVSSLYVIHSLLMLVSLVPIYILIYGIEYLEEDNSIVRKNYAQMIADSVKIRVVN